MKMFRVFLLTVSMFLAGFMLASCLFMYSDRHVASPPMIVMPDDPTSDEYERRLCLQLDRRELLDQREAYVRALEAFRKHLER